MPDVSCWNLSCLYNGDEECKKDHIVIGDDCECCNFVNYTETEEYRHEFWIACTDRKTGQAVRKRREGKRIERGELVFFTTDNDRYSYDCMLTEASTGQSAGHISRIDERIPMIKERLKEYPDVMSLPISEEAP